MVYPLINSPSQSVLFGCMPKKRVAALFLHRGIEIKQNGLPGIQVLLSFAAAERRKANCGVKLGLVRLI